ncbi:MAG TPA: trans-aconitate 2-methyltransferase [Bordetella sp.]
MSWSAKQYVTFEDERTRPVRDLLAAIPAHNVRSAVDIGCGPGNSTEILAAHFPDATVSGLDSSGDMIEAARKRMPRVHFDIGSIEAWTGTDPFDVILANAVLQWVPDHVSLLPLLVERLAPGGSLAIQMPDNLEEPAHRVMREIALTGKWAAKLAKAFETRAALPSADWYYELLKKQCVKVDVWRTIYHHPLAGGASAVVEWFKGSALGPFLEPLDGEERAQYLAEYLKAIDGAYRTLSDGSVLLPFPRLFIVATR